MPTMLLDRQIAATEAHIESDEEIAEMMAEAARVDAMFQSGVISTMFLAAFTDSIRNATMPLPSPNVTGDAVAEYHRG